MTDNADTKEGLKFGDRNSAVYMTPEAIKEFENNIKGNNNLENDYFNLINSWLQSDSHPPRMICKKIKGGKTEELYELKKQGTQARFLGYYEGSDFFILKCIQKKYDKLKPKDIQALTSRKQNFSKENINWKAQNE